MASRDNQDSGPDLGAGIPTAMLDGKTLLQGHVGEETVVLARVGEEVFALGGTCSHYGAPLADGLIVGDTLRCPWHHACFSLRTGEALAAPAIDPLGRWHVEHQGDHLFVKGKIPKEQAGSAMRDTSNDPERIVIVGGGAAGFAAAEMLRRRDFSGQLTMLSSDDDAPYDRPNLSKDYLAGTAEEAWMPLRSPKFYARRDIDLRLGTTAIRIDTGKKKVTTSDGHDFSFDRLLLATGAEPVRLSIPGADRPHVFVLRSMSDCRAMIDRLGNTRSAVVVGAGFIGLEVAASLRTRSVAVHVVAPGAGPLETVLGQQLGDFIRSVHEEHGVTFHLGATAERIDERTVRLSDGEVLDADMVVVGIGVKPRLSLAADAGIATAGGVLVDEFLETNIPGIFAAGDIAEWSEQRGAETRRVEHWVVAERQGQVAAENMLGLRQPFRSVPFFWSAHFDETIRYIGYARSWDTIDVEGSIEGRDCMVTYRKDGRTLAAATIGRDVEALRCEAAMAGETE
ncbi:FAD-dependent oxidoreductase [Mesorhizobium sp. L-8-3]|uniref:FAD-dependent oxidoreductase n=1 Tax=Mesorhizobium sp. L-8-3 TaxID=2744522 RepID=UPI001928F3D8|nr:FAD-dependent oxidoreductase [Mesorhizobium sp. L-8-3]BCH25493.1 pyridine nucleotide-disulfide oxidoreductase [Mesorhizobium sp. L-8-3]